MAAGTCRGRSLVSFVGGVDWRGWLKRLGLRWSVSRPGGTEEAIPYLFELLVWWQSQVSIHGSSRTSGAQLGRELLTVVGHVHILIRILTGREISVGNGIAASFHAVASGMAGVCWVGGCMEGGGDRTGASLT